MEEQTREHLETAERNRDFARSLLGPPVGPLLAGPRFEWVAVVAFYAAVHFVNAYLWERHRIAPASHAERRWHIGRDPILRRCAYAYRRLQDTGFKSRYAPLYQVSESRAQELVNVHLTHIEATVMAVI